LTSAAIALIRDIRASLPSRQVQGIRSVRGIYPSSKMGVGIQFESHTNELPTVSELEHQDRYREYYDQPPKVMVKYFDESAKRNVGYEITPDFFQISDKPGWIECKKEDELKKLAQKMPEMYVRDPDGTWRCPPGEVFAAKYGLSFSVRSSESTDWIKYQNLIFLEDYFDGPEIDIPGPITEAVTKTIQETPGITLGELLKSVTGVTPDSIHFLIARFLIYTDLSSALLTEPHKVRLYGNQRIAKAHALTAKRTIINFGDDLLIEPRIGMLFECDGSRYKIIHLGVTSVTLAIDDSDEIIDWPLREFQKRLKREQLKPIGTATESDKDILAFLRTTDPRALEEAVQRQELLGDARIDPMSCTGRWPTLTRNQYRWQKRARLAILENRPALMGLVPQHKRKGNRKKRIRLRTARIVLRVTKSDYVTPTKPNAFACWGKICNECDAIGAEGISYKTYLRILARRDRLHQIRQREGDRVAHNFEPPYWYLNEHTPRHGSRAFEIVHADHTQIDMFTKCRRTGKVLGKGWMTKLTDAYSRKVLAVYISYRAPSVLSIMAALRVFVRRHGRLPQILVVDNGPEFHSTDFGQLAAWYRITVKWRPPRKPRFGSIDERLFGTFTTRVLHNQPGNTQALKRVRTLTASHDPRRLAEWTLEDFAPWMEEFFYEVYDTTSHPALGQSPREAFAYSLANYGLRKHKFVASYEVFRRLTMVTPKQPYVTIQPKTGARINYNDYWAEEFSEPGIMLSKAPSKYDADDYSTAYIWIKTRWVKCRSPHCSIFEGLTEEEVRFYTEELVKQRQEHEKKRPITARAMALFIERMAAARRDLPVMLEAEANRRLADHFENGSLLSQTRTTPSINARNGLLRSDTPDSIGSSSLHQIGEAVHPVENQGDSGFVGDWNEEASA
jgi:transposase InsO family protein